MKRINLNDRSQVLAAILKDLKEDLSYFFSSDQEKLEFIDFTLQNNPFGVFADMAGVGFSAIKKHKIKASEILEMHEILNG